MTKRNLYVFDDLETDQHRLLLQVEMGREYLESHAPDFVPTPPRRILELGSGVGYVSVVLHHLYPEAELVGIDINPEAVAAARQQPGVDDKMTFVVGDVEKELPPGPFDLVYGSFILLYVRDLAGLAQQVYSVLAPGGTFWIKDLHPDMAGKVTPEDYKYLAALIFQALQQMGFHPHLGNEMPDLLTAAGFTDVRLDTESYPVAGETIEGEICMANGIAVFHNARKMISRMTNVPEEEILRRCDALVALAQSSTETLGEFRTVNIVARRPA